MASFLQTIFRRPKSESPPIPLYTNEDGSNDIAISGGEDESDAFLTNKEQHQQHQHDIIRRYSNDHPRPSAAPPLFSLPSSSSSSPYNNGNNTNFTIGSLFASCFGLFRFSKNSCLIVSLALLFVSFLYLFAAPPFFNHERYHDFRPHPLAPPPPRCYFTPAPTLTKPAGLQVVARVFAGRKETLRLLDCYLKQNLASNGGWLNEVEWVIRSDDKMDRDYVQNTLIPSSPYYTHLDLNLTRAQVESSAGYSQTKKGTVYIKIDDDIVYIHPQAIPRLVSRLVTLRAMQKFPPSLHHPPPPPPGQQQQHHPPQHGPKFDYTLQELEGQHQQQQQQQGPQIPPGLTFLSANVINHSILSSHHARHHAVQPFVPSSDPKIKPSKLSWKVNHPLPPSDPDPPYWDEESNAWSWQSRFDIWKSQPWRLITKGTDQIQNLLSFTPMANVEVDNPFGSCSWASPLCALQQLYSLLSNLQTAQEMFPGRANQVVMAKYDFCPLYTFQTRWSINFFAFYAGDIPQPGGWGLEHDSDFPGGDEHFISVELPKRTGQMAAAVGDSLVAHASFGTQHWGVIDHSDIVDRFASFVQDDNELSPNCTIL